MNDTVHYTEYSAVKKYEGRYGRLRRLAIFLYILCPLLLLAVMLLLIGPAAVIWFVPFCPTFLLIVVRTTYNRFFRIEYDYRIAGGEFEIAEVYHKQSRRVIFTARIADFETIVPYRDPYRETCDSADCRNTVEAVSSLSSPDLYCAILPDPEDSRVKTRILFDVNAAMLRLLNYYNRKTVVVPVSF